MKIFGRILITTAAILCSAGEEMAQAGFILDQSNVVNTFRFDAAVVSDVSRGQTFTAGLAGELAQVDLEIYKSTNTVVDPTFEILGTTGGAPDASKVLYQTTISLSSIPTFDTPPTGSIPFTSVDVSSAGIMQTPGEVLALVLIRNGPGAPPWLLWRQGIGGYAGGDSYYASPPSAPYAIDSPYEGGFQTFVSAVPEPSSVGLALIGLGCLVVTARSKARRPMAGA